MKILTENDKLKLELSNSEVNELKNLLNDKNIEIENNKESYTKKIKSLEMQNNYSNNQLLDLIKKFEKIDNELDIKTEKDNNLFKDLNNQMNEKSNENNILVKQIEGLKNNNSKISLELDKNI